MFKIGRFCLLCTTYTDGTDAPSSEPLQQHEGLLHCKDTTFYVTSHVRNESAGKEYQVVQNEKTKNIRVAAVRLRDSYQCGQQLQNKLL
jgi:hypothetical protein